MDDLRTSERSTAPLYEEAPELDDLEALVESGDVGALDMFLMLLHPADMADLFRELHHKQWPRVLARLSVAQISDLMEELPDHLRDDLAEHLEHDQLTQVIEEMASDDAVDVLADLPEALARNIVESLDEEERREVEELLQYPEDSAGGLMQLELVSVPLGTTITQVVEEIRARVETVEDFHFVYVVDEAEHLVGVARLGDLIVAKPQTLVDAIVRRDTHSVTPDVDQEDVARMFKRYDLVAMPVVDDQGRLLGRILHDDVIDVIEEEANEDILQMAGAGRDEPDLVYTDQLLKIASVRLPWLLATLVGLTIPALLVWLFQLSFPHMMALIPFIPVIGAMGGNVGTQSSTIVVRGFATGHIDLHNLGRFLVKESVIGSLMGIACGLPAGVVAVVWHGDVMLAVTVAISMTAAVVLSALVGVVIPYGFRLVKIDPAIAAGPAVTTIDDILAIGIYYGVALLLLA